MSDQVQFEEDQILVDSASKISRESKLTGMIIRSGIVKNETQANYVLIGILVVSLLATIYVISHYLI